MIIISEQRLSANGNAARDRVALLLDQDSPFLELGAFAGFENADSTPSANLIAGIGNVRFVCLPFQICSMLTEQWPAVSSHVAHSDAERRRVE